MLSSLAIRAAAALAALFLAFLAVVSALYTGVTLESSSGKMNVTFLPDHWWAMLLLAVLAVAAAALCLPRLERWEPRKTAHGVQLWLFGAALLVVLGGRCGAVGDQSRVLDMAAQAAQGDLGFLHSAYLLLCPPQLGLILYTLPQALVAGADNWLFYQLLNCLWLLLLVWMLYRCAALLFHSRAAVNLTLLLAAGCLPLVFYCAFAYGEMAGLALGLTAVYWQLRFLQSRRWAFLAASAATLALAVQLRQPTLVLMIAMCLVQMISALREMCRKNGIRPLLTAASALLLVAAVFGVNTLVGHLFYSRIGETPPPGATNLAWVAMGLSEGEKGYGYYNGFEFAIAKMSNYDYDTMEAMAKDCIREKLSGMCADKRYAVRFFYYKQMQQWNEPSLDMFVMTNAADGRAPWMETFWSGAGCRALYVVANGYQFLVYFFALLGAVNLLRRPDAQKMLFPLHFVGGFLLSTVWECMSRYALPYYVLMIPLAAEGLWIAAQGTNAALEKWQALPR